MSSQSALILAAKFFGFGLSFFLPLLIVRYLSQEEVGIYRQVFLLINTAVSILPLGMGMSAYYFLSREPELRDRAVFNILLFFVVLGGIFFLLLTLNSASLNTLFGDEGLNSLAPLVATVVWLWLVGSFLEILILANREVWLASLTIVLVQLSKALAMLAAVFLVPAAKGFLYAAVIQGAIQLAFLAYYLYLRFPRFLTSFDPRFFRRHLMYAIPLGVAGILWTLQTDLHNYFVANKFTAAEFAIYAYGCFQLPVIGLMTESVTAVLIPRISELQLVEDKRAILDLMGRALHKLGLVFFPLYVFMLITAETLITTLFTSRYAESVPIFLVNLTLLPFYAWVLDPIIRAFTELGRLLLGLRIVLTVVLIGALSYGVSNFGLVGMISIVVFVTLFEKSIMTAFVLRKLKVTVSDLSILKKPAFTAIASLFAGVFAYLTHFAIQQTEDALWSIDKLPLFGSSGVEFGGFLAGLVILAITLMVFLAAYVRLQIAFGNLSCRDLESSAAIQRVVMSFRKR